MTTQSLQDKDRQYLWHPYTQMHDYATRNLLLVDHADGICLYDDAGRRYFDTISSWWCIVHGHNHPVIKAALRRQLDRLDHVLFAGTTHEPAILLAEQLVAMTPAGLTRVFYSDNGSTACEVALKMSIQYWRHTGHPRKRRYVALERGYHGDTIGTMSLGGVPEFHQAFVDMMFESYRIPSPYCYRCPMGQKQNDCSLECLAPLEQLLAEKADEIAGLIMEPLIQAAGGMIVYPAAYLSRAAALARQYKIHLVLDEVATGFGRTGRMFALEHAGVEPDFICLSKGLTGGILPMAATMTTDEIYGAFYGDYQEGKTFFHGHTFTGNPLAAAVALASARLFDEEKTLERLKTTVPLLRDRMARFLELPWVGDVRRIGMIAALELVRDKTTQRPFDDAARVGWHIYLAGLKEGLLLRPLGNVLYLWLPLSTTSEEIEQITERTWRVLSNPENIAGWSGGS